MPTEPTPSPRRIKVKGKSPRGLSKAQRMKIEGYRLTSSGDYDPAGLSAKDAKSGARSKTVREYVKTAKRGLTAPSSTRKKMVKEGSHKFVGPRQLSSELAENAETETRMSEGAPVKYITGERGPGKAGHIYEVDEGGILPFETSKEEMRKLRRLNKETGASSKKRAMQILDRILNQYINDDSPVGQLEHRLRYEI